MRNPSGHTLLEILIVLALVLIVAGMASAGFLNQLSHHRLNGAVRNLVSDLRLARELAIAGGVPVSVVLDSEGETYRVQRNFPDGPVIRFRDLKDSDSGYRGVDLVGSTGGNRVNFFPKGTTNTFTTIRVSSSSGEEKRVSVAVTGRVRVR